MKKKKHLQIFFPLIRHTLLLSNLWKYLYKCNTRDDLEKDQTWQRIRSEVTRARTHMLCVCVCKRERAWRPSFCARARDLCHRRASGESGRERGAVRRQKKYHKGRRGTSRAGNAPDVEEEEREEISSLSFLWLPLSHAFPFCSGIRSRIHETTSAACRRSIEKLGVIAALDFQPEMTIEHRQTLWKLSFFLCK